MTSADILTEIAVLEGNLASGTCVGEPASPEQQRLRRSRLRKLRLLLPF